MKHKPLGLGWICHCNFDTEVHSDKDIKSAVEWFRRKSCYNWRVKNHHCTFCVLLNKDFEDVIKK